MEEFYQIRNGVLESYTGREEELVVPDGVHTIGTGAFKACISLKRVVLPPGLAVIGNDAFKGCRKLEEIKVPDGVKIIGSYAFHRCHALRRICLPDSVEEVGDCAFLYCDRLVEARLPGVKRLGAQMFLNDVRLQKVELSVELEAESICDMFTGCSRITEIILAGGEHVRIANAVEAAASGQDMPPLARQVVTDILKMMELEGRRLVRFLINLKHVEIPEGVESLAKSCFFDKRGIVSVTLPGSLREIESRAFRNCISLEQIEFQGEEMQGEEVEIREDAFRNCTSLKTIRLGKKQEYQLTGLVGVTEVSGNGQDIPDMVLRIQKQVLGNFRLSGTILLRYLGEESRVVVPEGITRIGAEAFAGKEAIDRVILPESLAEIGAEAFRDCLLLQSISFPEGLCRIGAGAFEHCVKLLRVNLPSGLSQVEERTFRHCLALHEVTLPKGLRKIGEGAFYGCISLKKLAFPERLEEIGELAFYRCDSLKEVHLPAATERVQSLAFAKSGVRRVQIAGSGQAFGRDVFGSCPKLKTMVLEERVLHIADKLAYGCTALERVILPEQLQSIGQHVLEESPFLEHWRIEQREGMRNLQENDSVFWDGRELEGIVALAEGVQIIAGGAFYGNKRVREIRLPESVRFIGRAAFEGCTELRRLVMPAGIREIEPELCSGCVKLEEVVVKKRTGTEYAPEYLTLGDRAFYQCRALRKLSLQQTTYIGKEALTDCQSLEQSAVHERLWAGERAFDGTPYVKDMLEIRGSTEQSGGIFVGKVLVSGEGCQGNLCLPEGITRIAPYAFAGNRSLTGIELPASLEEIGEGAFFGCSGLSWVKCSDSGQGEGKNRTKIGARAFEKCSSLQEIETAAEQIGTGAFSFCTALQRALLPGITEVSDRLFEGCAALKECVCKNVETAGESSFCGCQALEEFPFAALRIIKKRAFEGCDSLQVVTLQRGSFLEEYAFRDCGRLLRIELLPADETPVDSVSLVAEGVFREYAFSGCTALRTVNCQGKSWTLSSYQDIRSEAVPEVVRRIWDSAFSCFEVEGEERLCAYRGAGKVLHIPEGIRQIEAEVFRNCMQLQEVTFPESLKEIGARAFHGTEWLERQKRQTGMVIVKDMLLDASTCQKEVTIPADIRLVCGWAFANGLQISSIRFQSERTRVGDYAFRNCVFLEQLYLPDGTCVTLSGLSNREKDLPPLAKQAACDSMNCFKTDEKGVLVECTGNISVLRLADGITAVGDGAFEDGNLLTEIFFSDTVWRIGRRAFAGCKWLTEVRQAEHVQEIGEQAFSGCGRLRRIELSEKLLRLGARAFENCTSLEEIKIPEGVVEIPEKAFYRCHSLKRIELPSTIERIGKDAFAFCGCQVEPDR